MCCARSDFYNSAEMRNTGRKAPEVCFTWVWLNLSSRIAWRKSNNLWWGKEQKPHPMWCLQTQTSKATEWKIINRILKPNLILCIIELFIPAGPKIISNCFICIFLYTKLAEGSNFFAQRPKHNCLQCPNSLKHWVHKCEMPDHK